MQNVVGLVAGLSLSGNGLVVDPADAAFQSLAVGESAVITVGYDVVDAQGAAVAQTAPFSFWAGVATTRSWISTPTEIRPFWS